jgi:phospholipid transport system transporter-binding protein
MRMQAIAVPPRIDIDNAPEALAELARALGVSHAEQPGTETVLDLSGLAQFDSGALAVLVQLVRERSGLATAGTGGPGRLLFTGAPPKLRELAALYGVDELLFGAGAVG